MRLGEFHSGNSRQQFEPHGLTANSNDIVGYGEELRRQFSEIKAKLAINPDQTRAIFCRGFDKDIKVTRVTRIAVVRHRVSADYRGSGPHARLAVSKNPRSLCAA